MASTAEVPGCLMSALPDLSAVPLHELGGVSGLPASLAVLQARLAQVRAPLCEGQMAAACAGTPWAEPGTTVTVDQD